MIKLNMRKLLGVAPGSVKASLITLFLVLVFPGVFAATNDPITIESRTSTRLSEVETPFQPPC